ncbi:putative metalloprotease CJM1_0395 family protein, partial [Shewanella sp.]
MLPNVAADSPQFNLKQGAISVQGLLGLQSFSSNTLDTVSSVSSSSFKSAITSQVIDDPNLSTGLAGKVTNSQPNTAPTEQVPAQEVAKPSVAESFASIYGDEADENSIVKQMDEDDSVAQTKQNDQQSSDVDAAITKQAQSEQESKQQNQDAIKQQEQQLAQKTEKIEAAQVNQLSKRDTEVKTHEQAHAAVGGVHAQSPSFTYEKGPDGKRYAVDGEVQIDVSVVNGDAQATLNKMMKVYSAAMAPVQPSMADIRVAAEALQKMNAAREELAIERQQSVIELDDVDHIIGLGEKMKTSQQEEQFSQLEPFKKSPDDPLISISGIDNTESKANSRNTSSSVQ